VTGGRITEIVDQQAALEGWLRFNDEDISFNRDGRLSPRQRGKLLRSAAWRLGVGPVVAVGAAAVAATALDTAIAELLALVSLGIGLLLAWTGFAYMVDAVAGMVAHVTSTLQTHVVSGRSTTYYVDVGPVHKPIGRKGYGAIAGFAGASCHLYYAPGCRSLLSLEPASATEPLPAHPFGPDSVHAWDRLRWSWIALTVGLFATLIGAHLIGAAHPARAVEVTGVMSNYVETHGRSTSRTIDMDNGNSYTPQAEADYTPAPDFDALIGKRVVLYVDDGTTDVLAVNDGETTYAGDWYLHPDHRTAYEVTNGIVTTLIGAVILAAGVWLLLRDRRRSEQYAGRPAAYTPPTVQPVRAQWPAVVAIAGVLVLFVIALAVGVR